MEFKTWDMENIEEKLKEEDGIYEEKSLLKYDDSYFNDYKNFCAFPAVANFLACGMDYSDKGLNKIDSIDTLKEKLKSELDVSFISSFDQRLSHVSSQNSNTK